MNRDELVEKYSAMINSGQYPDEVITQLIDELSLKYAQILADEWHRIEKEGFPEDPDQKCEEEYTLCDVHCMTMNTILDIMRKFGYCIFFNKEMKSDELRKV